MPKADHTPHKLRKQSKMPEKEAFLALLASKYHLNKEGIMIPNSGLPGITKKKKASSRTTAQCNILPGFSKIFTNKPDLKIRAAYKMCEHNIYT